MNDARINGVLREHAPKLVGALVRRHRDLQACEDAVQEALLTASREWSRSRIPDEPRGWLLHVANRRVIDAVRSETSRRLREEVVVSLVPADEQHALAADEALAAEHDDSLDLLFLCCHSELSHASAIALTLRAVGGLTTAEIARAFLVPESTMGQRLSRARQTVKDAGISGEPLNAAQRAERLPAVLQVLYLMFNEGYAATEGASVHRVELASEALRLSRLLNAMLPSQPEVMGLLSLMLLTDARRAARVGEAGELIPLDEQDRSKWNREQIEEGSELIENAFALGAVGAFQLQAAIASLHSEAASTESTDWPQIVALYEVLMRVTGNPMVALNHAVAWAMVKGPRAGLEKLNALSELQDNYRLIAARGHLLERLGERADAAAAFRLAAQKTGSIAERNFLLLRAASLIAR